LIARLREHRAIAQQLAGWIESRADWELVAPVPFSLVCFRYAPRGVSAAEQDRLNEAIMHAVNASGEMFISHTKLSGRFTLRLSIGNIRTSEGQVAAAWNRLQSAAISSA
jgi:aromatic-L-amino-acid decarboxylase